MRKFLDNDWLTLAARIALATILFYAAQDKILNPDTFYDSIENYDLLAESFIYPLSRILPWIEVAIGLAFLLGIKTRFTGFIASLMFIVFIAAISSTIVRGLEIDCGCFAAAEDAPGSPYGAIARDVGFLILSLQTTISRSKKWTLLN